MVPTEITIKASAVEPALHDALTERRRFNFKFSESPHGPVRLFTACAEQAEEPGLIRIFDIRDAQFIS